MEINGEVAISLAQDADVVIVAGDVHAGVERGFRYLRRNLGPDVPIIAVAGNHDFYGREIDAERALAPRLARDHAITWLDDETAIIAGVRFVGATLWTDYDLFGSDLRKACMEAAALSINDHRMIRTGAGAFTPEHARRRHLASRRFIDAALAADFAGSTIVVTHHAPHERCVAQKFRGSQINPAFVSDLSRIIDEHQPALWVHGHTHASLDFSVGATRILCNPLGYGRENPAFDPEMVVSV